MCHEAPFRGASLESSWAFQKAPLGCFVMIHKGFFPGKLSGCFRKLVNPTGVPPGKLFYIILPWGAVASHSKVLTSSLDNIVNNNLCSSNIYSPCHIYVSNSWNIYVTNFKFQTQTQVYFMINLVHCALFLFIMLQFGFHDKSSLFCIILYCNVLFSFFIINLVSYAWFCFFMVNLVCLALFLFLLIYLVCFAMFLLHNALF